jgi:hypothetical protein
MSNDELPQIERLILYPSVISAMEFLSPVAYQDTLAWIRNHFHFAYGQQIDWSHDPGAVTGKILELTEEKLQGLLKNYGVEASRRITIVWAYGDKAITLPLHLVAAHIKDIWLPALDDVFLFDPQDVWCVELYHEGNFSCGRFYS